jgi:Zn-dependent protease
MGWLEAVVLRVAHMGPWGVVLFIAAYVVAAITLAPAFILTFAAGAIFGLWRGTMIVFLAALLGAMAVYGLAAPLARGRLMRRLERDARVAAIRKAVVGDALWVMFLLRLSPLVPYVLLNYALALFNLVPLPPLDGSKVVESVLPMKLARKYESLAQYGFLILLGLAFTGAFSFLSVPIQYLTEMTLLGAAAAFSIPAQYFGITL